MTNIKWKAENGMTAARRYCQALLFNYDPVVDLLDAPRGSGDVFGPAPGLSVVDSALESDHAVLHYDLRADDSFRDIPSVDLRQNRQIARRHTRAFSGVVSSVRFDRDVINDARYAFTVSGYQLGLLLLGL